MQLVKSTPMPAIVSLATPLVRSAVRIARAAESTLFGEMMDLVAPLP